MWFCRFQSLYMSRRYLRILLCKWHVSGYSGSRVQIFMKINETVAGLCIPDEFKPTLLNHFQKCQTKKFKNYLSLSICFSSSSAVILVNVYSNVFIFYNWGMREHSLVSTNVSIIYFSICFLEPYSSFLVLTRGLYCCNGPVLF